MVLPVFKAGAQCGRTSAPPVRGGQPELGPPTFQPDAYRVPPGLPLCLSKREPGCLESLLLQQRRQRPVLREGGKLCGIRVPHLVFGQADRRRHGRKRCDVVCVQGGKTVFGKTFPHAAIHDGRVEEGRRLVYLSSSGDAASPKKRILFCCDVSLEPGHAAAASCVSLALKKVHPSLIAWPESCRRPKPARTFSPGSIALAGGFPHGGGADHFSTPLRIPAF